MHGGGGGDGRRDGGVTLQQPSMHLRPGQQHFVMPSHPPPTLAAAEDVTVDIHNCESSHRC